MYLEYWRVVCWNLDATNQRLTDPLSQDNCLHSVVGYGGEIVANPDAGTFYPCCYQEAAMRVLLDTLNRAPTLYPVVPYYAFEYRSIEDIDKRYKGFLEAYRCI